MASVEAKDIPVMQQFMGVFWNFIKQYYIPEDNDDYWNGLMEHSNVLAEKFPDELAQMLISTFDDYVTKKHHGRLRPVWRKPK